MESILQTSVDQVSLRRRGIGLRAYDPELSAGGYTLIAAQTDEGRVRLIDILGNEVHRWNMPVRPGRAAVILPNGHLGYNGRHPDSPSIYPAWSVWHGGDFYEATPEGKIVWRYQDPMHHHDARWLPNGHLLYAACEALPREFSSRIPGGATSHPDAVVYGDVVREVDRQGRLVWEWKTCEHLSPEDYPIHACFGRAHWPLINGLGTTRSGTVLMSLRTTSSIIEVERGTGAVVRRAMPPLVSQQHAPVELDNGHWLAFDNGNERPGQHVPYSRVVEIDPDRMEIVWSYADPLPAAFFSAFMGNAQRLPNGNTHVTESSTGRLFEVTPNGELVWEYVIPWFSEYPEADARQAVCGAQNTVFQTYRYSPAQLPWLR